MTQAAQSATGKFVLSYSRHNVAQAERLFDDLECQGIACWMDRHDLLIGRDWEISVRDAIRASRGLLLLATPESAQSPNVRNELAMAFANALPIFPIWLAGGRYEDCIHKDYEKLHAVDVRGEAYASGLIHLITMLTGHPPPTATQDAPTEPPRNPYKGLHAFRYEDRDRFFGRTAFVTALLDKLHTQPASARLLAVIGASGSGKSSVVMAGLLPAMHAGELDGSTSWVYLDPITPTAQPLEQLALALNKGLPARSTAAIEEDLAHRSCRGLHRLAAQMVTPGQRVVLIVDQFEELFTLCRDAEAREQFLNLLCIAATEPNGTLQVLLTLRADFTDKALAHPALCALLQDGTAYVPPLALADLVDAIKRPAELPGVGLSFDDGLVTEIAFDVNDRTGALPLLQFALDELFRRRDGRNLTRAAYEAMGRLEGALAQRADEIYAALPPPQQGIAQRIFLELVQLGEGSEDTRRRAVLSEVATGPNADDVSHVANHLAHERLLTLDRDGQGQPTLEVAHEALIQHWPRLREWLDANREALRLKRQIEDDAREWLRLERDEGALYRGAKLAQASEWAEQHVDELGDTTAEFLRASKDTAQRESVEREAARQHELAQARALADEQRLRAEEQSHASVRLRQRVRIALTALVIALLSFGIAMWFAQQARQNMRRAEAQMWASRALLPGLPGPHYGLLRAAKALDIGGSGSLLFDTPSSPLLRGQIYKVIDKRENLFNLDTDIKYLVKDWDGTPGSNGKVTFDGKALSFLMPDGHTMIMSVDKNTYVLGDLGLGVLTTKINTSGDTIMAKYADGEIYLFDLEYLRMVHGRADQYRTHNLQPLINIICARLKARPEWFPPETMRAALDGEDPPAACLQ